MSQTLRPHRMRAAFAGLLLLGLAASEVAAAQGHFVHVYVHRGSRRPVSELPGALQRALEPLRVATTPTPEEAP